MSKAKRPKRVCLVGGGSGGHIIPNLVVADTLKKAHPSTEIMYVGSRRALDRALVPRTIPFYAIHAGKLRRYFSWQNFVDPFLILMGFFQSLWLLVTKRPNVVFSKGGYVSLPMNLAAFITRTPLILHESDSRMGLANRISAKLSNQLCIAFPNLKKQYQKAIITGNPIRGDLKKGDKTTGYQRTKFPARRSGGDNQKPVILIWGGSQGAQQINELVEKEFDELMEHFQIIHITGAHKPVRRKHAHYVQYEYVNDDLKHLYAITDVAISRAGANSLFELAYLEIPMILLPLKNADQQGNATYFVENGGARLYHQEQTLVSQLKDLLKNQQTLGEVKKSLKKLATPEAAETIVNLILSER